PHRSIPLGHGRAAPHRRRAKRSCGSRRGEKTNPIKATAKRSWRGKIREIHRVVPIAGDQTKPSGGKTPASSSWFQTTRHSRSTTPESDRSMTALPVSFSWRLSVLLEACDLSFRASRQRQAYVTFRLQNAIYMSQPCDSSD